MTKHAFLEGMGLGVLAGAAIGMAVAAKSCLLYTSPSPRD